MNLRLSKRERWREGQGEDDREKTTMREMDRSRETETARLTR